jgi:capsular polysaccharide biosynthesis protein
MNRQRLSNVSVIDAGAVPSRPATSRLGLPLALGLFLSLLGALLYGVVAERLGQTLSTPEAVERRLDIPVLASVHHHA